MNNVINIYKDACGLFKEVQFRALATAIINLVVSIVLVKKIGINGVYIGTVVAYITTIYIVDPRVVFSNVFEMKSSIYYKDLLRKAVLFCIVFQICKRGLSKVEINSWVSLIVCFVIVSASVNLCLLIVCVKTEEFVYLKNRIKSKFIK